MITHSPRQGLRLTLLAAALLAAIPCSQSQGGVALAAPTGPDPFVRIEWPPAGHAFDKGGAMSVSGYLYYVNASEPGLRVRFQILWAEGGQPAATAEAAISPPESQYRVLSKEVLEVEINLGTELPVGAYSITLTLTRDWAPVSSVGDHPFRVQRSFAEAAADPAPGVAFPAPESPVGTGFLVVGLVRVRNEERGVRALAPLPAPLAPPRSPPRSRRLQHLGALVSSCSVFLSLSLSLSHFQHGPLSAPGSCGRSSSSPTPSSCSTTLPTTTRAAASLRSPAVKPPTRPDSRSSSLTKQTPEGAWGGPTRLPLWILNPLPGLPRRACASRPLASRGSAECRVASVLDKERHAWVPDRIGDLQRLLEVPPAPNPPPRKRGTRACSARCV